MIAKEGIKEISAGTILLAGLAIFLAWAVHWSAAILVFPIWVWLIAFFRDPPRRTIPGRGDILSAADGVVTEVTEVIDDERFTGISVRIGVFLSLFNVHANRSPISGRVRDVLYKPGEFLDARHLESGERNESNTLVVDPEPPMAGPVIVRQVAGWVARRIVCHVISGDHMKIGQRFGMIKFGSRTEVILPVVSGTQVRVKVGDKVSAGITILATQPVAANDQGDKIDSRKMGVTQ